ncbi:MAG: PocR ligand-binding domain-containing protein, partial [Candidatus Hydrogenedentota bacterium]
MQTPANSGSTSDQILARVRGQVAPAFAFAESYLRLLSEELGLGALAVWFGAEGIEHYISGKSNKSKEFEWQDSLSDLLHTTTRLGPPGQSAFCATLRKHAEADRRCHECDAKWIARTRKSGRSWAYECHAGLSEVIAPIEVKGKRIGEIMGGQLASTEKLPRGFENVWQRVKDIKGLDRSRLEKAFAQVTAAVGVRSSQLHRRAEVRTRRFRPGASSAVKTRSR